MAECTIVYHGRGIYKLNSGTIVSLNGGEATYSFNASDSVNISDVGTYIKKLTPLDIFYNANPSMPMPIWVKDNSVSNSKLRNYDGPLDLYIDHCENGFYKGNSKIRYVTVKSGENENAVEMFANCSNLKGARIETVNVSDASSMFANCESLEDISGFQRLVNTTADYIFSKDKKLAKTIGKKGVKDTIDILGHGPEWYDGLNRTYFWDCPYNGTLPEWLANQAQSGADYDWQKSQDNFNPNILILKAINSVPLKNRLDTLNETSTPDPDIKSEINFIDSSEDNLLNLHFDNTNFSVSYDTELPINGTDPSNWVRQDPHISMTDNYEDKVKGIQNLLYNLKDIWDYGAFENTKDPTLELNTSVVLNMEHNGPKLNDVISPIWDPDDNFRLHLKELDVSNTIKETKTIQEHYWDGPHTYNDKRINNNNWVNGNLFIPQGAENTERWYNWVKIDAVTHLEGNYEELWGWWIATKRIQTKHVPVYEYRITNTQYNTGSWVYVRSDDEYKDVPLFVRRFKNSQGVEIANPQQYEWAYAKTTWTPQGGAANSAWSINGSDRTVNLHNYVEAWPRQYYIDKTRPLNIQVPKKVRLQDSDCPAQDISGIFKDVPYIKTIDFSINKIMKADELFMNCKNIESAIGSIANQGRIKVESAKHIFDGAFITDPHIDFIVDTLDAESAFENSGVVDPTFFTSWTSVLNGNKLFKNSKVGSLRSAVFPEGIQTIAEAFADCENLVDVEGNWLQPNSSMHYQNYTYHLDTNSWTKDWINPVTKDGYFYFPDSVQDIHSIFKDSGLKSVKELALLRFGNNDNVFDGCHNLTEIENLYLNENPNYGNIFYDTPNQNKDWRIWFPSNIKSSYLPAAEIGLDPYKVSDLYCDDGFIVVDNESPDSQVQRRVAYEGVLNPDKKFRFNYFSHIHPHTVDNRYFYHHIHDVDVWYK